MNATLIGPKTHWAQEGLFVTEPYSPSASRWKAPEHLTSYQDDNPILPEDREPFVSIACLNLEAWQKRLRNHGYTREAELAGINHLCRELSGQDVETTNDILRWNKTYIPNERLRPEYD